MHQRIDLLKLTKTDIEAGNPPHWLIHFGGYAEAEHGTASNGHHEDSMALRLAFLIGKVKFECTQGR